MTHTHPIIIMAEANLRNALDSAVDRIILKLDRKTFLESFPKVNKIKLNITLFIKVCRTIM